MTIELNAIEREVMRMLLYGDDTVLEILREQFVASRVAKHELTGVGFFTTFAIPADVPRAVGGKSFTLGDVKADIEGLEHGAGFVLFIKEGVIDNLEGYSYDEPWPETSGRFRVSYIGNDGKRDLASVRAKWA